MKKLFSAIITAIVFFTLNTVTAQTNTGGMIKFQTNGGPEGNAYYVPADKATDKVLIIFHEWWGLNDNIKQEAEQWQKTLGGNVAVYAVDLFDGKVATEKFAATKMMNNMDEKRGEAIIKGLLQKIGVGKQIATLGWGMGGTWAFTASTLIGKKAAGCVMYYGFPVKDDATIAAFKTDVLFFLGNQDEYITKKDMEDFNKKVTAVGRGFQYETFNGTNGFASLGNPELRQTPRKETQFLAVKFLKHTLSLD